MCQFQFDHKIEKSKVKELIKDFSAEVLQSSNNADFYDILFKDNKRLVGLLENIKNIQS